MKIWEKELLLRICKTFFAILFCCYLLYSLLDFSLHSTRLFTYSKISIFQIIHYYLHQFILRGYPLLSLTFLLTLVQVLTSMNTRAELAILYMAGISKRKVLRSFFIIATCFSFLSLAHFEWFYPRSFDFSETFKQVHLRKKKEGDKKHLFVVKISSESKLIYQEEKQKNHFFDVFYVVSKDEFFHMKELNNQEGLFVDHFLKEEGNFVKKESFERRLFASLVIPEEVTDKKLPEQLSISSLLTSSKDLKQKEQSQKEALLHFKIAMSLLFFPMIFAVAPFSLFFSRMNRVYLLLIFSLFGWLTFYTVMESALILASSTSFPLLVIWLPFSLFFSFSLYNFCRMK